MKKLKLRIFITCLLFVVVLNFYSNSDPIKVDLYEGNHKKFVEHQMNNNYIAQDKGNEVKLKPQTIQSSVFTKITNEGSNNKVVNLKKTSNSYNNIVDSSFNTNKDEDNLKSTIALRTNNNVEAPFENGKARDKIVRVNSLEISKINKKFEEIGKKQLEINQEPKAHIENNISPENNNITDKAKINSEKLSESSTSLTKLSSKLRFKQTDDETEEPVSTKKNSKLKKPSKNDKNKGKKPKKAPKKNPSKNKKSKKSKKSPKQKKPKNKKPKKSKKSKKAKKDKKAKKPKESKKNKPKNDKKNKDKTNKAKEKANSSDD